MARTVVYRSEEWEATLSSGSHGVASGYPPAISRWGVSFTPRSDPGRAAVVGHIGTNDLSNAPEAQLLAAL